MILIKLFILDFDMMRPLAPHYGTLPITFSNMLHLYFANFGSILLTLGILFLYIITTLLLRYLFKK